MRYGLSSCSIIVLILPLGTRIKENEKSEETRRVLYYEERNVYWKVRMAIICRGKF
jgi:hypothetical protein